MKIGFRRYLYMFSIVVIIDVFYTLAIRFFTVPYFEGVFNYFLSSIKHCPTSNAEWIMRVFLQVS
uniref:Uncharacterized protein n=1 Tax=Meloidogyne enterolobii TaxID=390850 RepID=A0A6V7TZS7_MELEN|nr:unnamed protein product [Meloidogyne enterolobii]